MEKSALQIARAAYQPKFPKALQGAVKVKEGAPTQSVGDQEEIKKLFPNTYGMPIVEFEPAFSLSVMVSASFRTPSGTRSESAISMAPESMPHQ